MNCGATETSSGKNTIIEVLRLMGKKCQIVQYLKSLKEKKEKAQEESPGWATFETVQL